MKINALADIGEHAVTADYMKGELDWLNTFAKERFISLETAIALRGALETERLGSILHDLIMALE